MYKSNVILKKIEPLKIAIIASIVWIVFFIIMSIVFSILHKFVGITDLIDGHIHLTFPYYLYGIVFFGIVGFMLGLIFGNIINLVLKYTKGMKLEINEL